MPRFVEEDLPREVGPGDGLVQISRRQSALTALRILFRPTPEVAGDIWQLLKIPAGEILITYGPRPEIEISTPGTFIWGVHPDRSPFTPDELYLALAQDARWWIFQGV